jgi:arylsulfatase A-like enzyme
MRGKKIDVYEGGIKVPGFAVWPRKIKPQRIDNPMHIVDWFPTIAQVVGFESTDPLSWDGVDQSPTILSGAKAPDRDFYWVQSNYRRAVRQGDWKAVSYSRQAPAKKEDWNLDNLVSDPLEKKNVANLHPEILADLHQRFLRHHRLDKK